MLEKRKKEHFSYVFDDGLRENKNLAFSNNFDTNNDNFLDLAETIEDKNGFDHEKAQKTNFITQTRVKNKPKIIYNNGEILFEGNFEKIDPKKNGKTLSSIKQQEKEEIKAKAILLTEKMFKSRPLKVDFTPYQNTKRTPEFQTISQKKQKKKESERLKIGLTDPTDLKA